MATGSAYKTAYLSLAVPLSGDLLSVQRDICRRFALLPRSEVHLTLAFFGENTARRLVDLAVALLDDLPSWELARVGIDGLGGAYEITGGLKLIRDEAPGDLNECPRVLWLAATASDELSAFRGRAIEAARRVGVNTAAVGQDFFPHLTLGFRGSGRSRELGPLGRPHRAEASHDRPATLSGDAASVEATSDRRLDTS